MRELTRYICRISRGLGEVVCSIHNCHRLSDCAILDSEQLEETCNWLPVVQKSCSRLSRSRPHWTVVNAYSTGIVLINLVFGYSPNPHGSSVSEKAASNFSARRASSRPGWRMVAAINDDNFSSASPISLFSLADWRVCRSTTRLYVLQTCNVC